jgi:hypothetical protein
MFTRCLRITRRLLVTLKSLGGVSMHKYGVSSRNF